MMTVPEKGKVFKINIIFISDTVTWTKVILDDEFSLSKTKMLVTRNTKGTEYL